MSSTHYPKHPFLRGYFATCSEEVRPARGQMSSGDFEVQAFECQQIADFFTSAARTFDRLIEETAREAARILGEQPEQHANIEAIAQELRQRFEGAKEERLCRARHHQQGANELHRYAQEAQAFEARFDFNPYVDKNLDVLERHNAQVLAEWQEKQRKAAERREARREARR